MKREGFWRSNSEPALPMPVPNILTEAESLEIFQRIKKKERTAKRTLYRGMAMSRLEKNVFVDNAEYSAGDWCWPGGYAEHYVRDHRVKPSDEFLEFLGYKSEFSK